MNTKLVAATLLSGLSLMGCNTSSTSTTTSSTATPTAVEFVGMAAPSTAAERADAYTTAKAVVTYSDNTTQTVDLSYTQLYGTTDNINGVTAGGLVDVSGFPLLDVSVPAVPTQFVSDAPDGQSLLQIAGADPVALGVSGNPLFMVTHFEYLTADNSGASAYGILPMAMGLSTIDQDATSGALSVVNYQNINMSGVNGLWIPCAGSLSPWNTHLGSEEYEPDARLFETTPTTGPFTPFTTQYYGGAQTARAYQYGAVPEVTVAPTGATSVVKHYSMGRIARELVQVMPDQKTVYMGDDGGYTGLFMFVADVAGDLSAGTLYAGKWTQTSAVDVGTADISWIQLGHATDAQIADLINGTTSGTPIVFSNIFLASSTDPLDVTYTKVRTNNGVEWLKLNPGMEQAAAFLETRRYAAYLGATTEFNKMEGVTINQADKKVYIAISYLQKGMVSGYAATDPADDIQLSELKSGAVYELSLTGGQSDINAIPATINSQWVATSMTGTVWGTDLTAPDAAGNTAAVDAVANPDNLKFAEKARTLFIGEDSAMHVNNFLWAYNVDTKKLSRIMSIPAGAESTGLQAVENMNGFAYVMSNFQHPGDYIGTMDATLMSQVDPLIRAKWNNKRKAAIGYLSGIPVIQ
jgi:uncharacterized protein